MKKKKPKHRKYINTEEFKIKHKKYKRTQNNNKTKKAIVEWLELGE